MVLAAGLGLRMRPITLSLPKPLIPIAGRSLIDRILDHLVAAGVAEAVVNTHHLGHVLERHLAGRGDLKITLSSEPNLLETGGGIANALPLLGDRPFYAINGDVLWRDGREPGLVALARTWQDEQMDALLLLQPTTTAIGYAGPGDFFLETTGRLCRRGGRPAAPFLFTGLQILHPRLFAEAPAEPFSLNVLFDRAIGDGRLFGVVHEGGWCHVGTPADIPAAEAFVEDASHAPHAAPSLAPAPATPAGV
jgi:MurNAc alpha-1-phosphate uridylyltransferase